MWYPMAFPEKVISKRWIVQVYVTLSKGKSTCLRYDHHEESVLLVPVPFCNRLVEFPSDRRLVLIKIPSPRPTSVSNEPFPPGRKVDFPYHHVAMAQNGWQMVPLVNIKYEIVSNLHSWSFTGPNPSVLAGI